MPHLSSISLGRLSRILAGLLLLAGVHAGAQELRPLQPEPASGRSEKILARAEQHMVAAAHPLAVEAGLQILDAGGSAMDAAIAVQLVLNLVEPQASGIGGGAFLLHFDADHRQTRAYDGRETAPAAATPGLFMEEGRPMRFRAAVAGGRAVGVPGTVRLLGDAHRNHGKLPWARLFDPAIALALDGYPLSARVHTLLKRGSDVAADPEASALFLNSAGQPKPVGTVLRNPAFARVLRMLATRGPDAFYEGPLAADIVRAVREHPRNPGMMQIEDLTAYRVREVTPLCRPYRVWRICGMPPSSSGGIAVMQILTLLEAHGIEKLAPQGIEATHLFAEAGRLAFADRNRYVADDRFVRVPVDGLLDEGYLAARAARINPLQAMGKARAGTPPGTTLALADDRHDEVSGTSHIAIVDRNGNAVSMTTTIESFFGSKVMVQGFLLNNQLTDFNFNPVEDGLPVANAVAPGKRPRSSMAPTLVFDEKGALHLVIGSPGGSRIINYVAQALIAILDWGMDVQAAISAPHAGSRNGPTELESGTAAAAHAEKLRAMGHNVHITDMTSGLHGIMRAADGWQGGADPRREGIAKGR
jgi:gamma-glutamyltranspeptidase/glutathione hydrolase